MHRSIILALVLLLFSTGEVLSQDSQKMSIQSEHNILQLVQLEKGETKYLKLQISEKHWEGFLVQRTSSSLPVNLREKYPEILSFSGSNADYQLSLTLIGNRIFGSITNGVDVIELSNRSSSPEIKNRSEHIQKTQHRANFDAQYKSCGTTTETLLNTLNKKKPQHKPTNKGITRSRGSTLRTYTLVLTVTGKQNKDLGNTTVAEGMAYAISVVDFVNNVFRREFAVQYELHPQNDKVIYLDAETDPYPTARIHDMNDILWLHNTTVFSLFEPNSFDTGFIIHPSSIGRGGGRPGNATKAFVGSCACNGLILHELGHHLGGWHSYHLDYSKEIKARQRSMVGNNTSYLHSVNFDRIKNTIDENPTIGRNEPTGNTPPVITLDLDGLSIPANTPFVLTGTAIDPDPDASLSYTWQQTQGGDQPADKLLFAHETPSATGHSRYIPSLESLQNNTVDRNATLPEVNRDIIARLVVRDNQPPVGGISYKEVTIAVDATAGPFIITYPNEEIIAVGGSEMQVQWNVAGTDNKRINTPEVDILLSTDRGLTWRSLAANTENDGIQTVTIPNIASTECRIKVAAVGNIFYAMSAVDFTISNNVPMVSIIKIANGMERESTTNVSFAIHVEHGTSIGTAPEIRGTLSFSGTATVNEDYQGATSFTVPKGENQVVLDIAITNDSLVEGTETVTATISQLSLGKIAVNTASATITDNDAAGFAISTSEIVLNTHNTKEQFNVVLTGAPLSEVILDIYTSNQYKISVDSTQLVFDKNNWNQPQAVTINVVDNTLANTRAEQVTVTVNPISDPAFQPLNDASITLVYIENENTTPINASQAFTPNGDGINDVWVIRGIQNYANNRVTVYDQSGKKVFVKSAYHNNWTGNHQAKTEKLIPGSYYYTIDLGNGSKQKKGWLFINY